MTHKAFLDDGARLKLGGFSSLSKRGQSEAYFVVDGKMPGDEEDDSSGDEAAEREQAQVAKDRRHRVKVDSDMWALAGFLYAMLCGVRMPPLSLDGIRNELFDTWVEQHCATVPPEQAQLQEYLRAVLNNARRGPEFPEGHQSVGKMLRLYEGIYGIRDST